MRLTFLIEVKNYFTTIGQIAMKLVWVFMIPRGYTPRTQWISLAPLASHKVDILFLQVKCLDNYWMNCHEIL